MFNGFIIFLLGAPLEDWDCESTLPTVAGDSIVRQGAACLRDAAIRLKTASIFFFLDCVCIVPMVYTDA